MTELMQEVTRAQQMVAEVAAAEGAVNDRKAELQATQVVADQIIKDVRQRVMAGESTGDLALDFKIILQGSVAQDDTYRRLTWLMELVASNIGELIVIDDATYHGWQMGVLADGPLGCDKPRWLRTHEAQHIYLPTEEHYKNAYLDGLTSGPIKIGFGQIAGYEVDLPRDQRRYHNLGPKFIVGQPEVQAWFEQLKLNDAFNAWVQSRWLGHPLSPSQELVAEIRRRREKRIVDLVEAQRTYKELRDKFAELRSNPLLALQNPREHRYTKTDTPEGVLLDFGLASPIEAARQKLIEMIQTSISELEMADSEIIYTSTQLIGIEL
jgi:hypothetical protein